MKLKNLLYFYAVFFIVLWYNEWKTVAKLRHFIDIAITMKKIISVLLLFAPFILHAQYVDSFSDGDFSQKPSWSGSIDKFIVNPANQLQLNAPATTSNAYLSTPSQAINNASWQFNLKAALLLTSANYVDYYLVSDNADLSSTLNGYYVMIGNTNKEVALYRQQGTTKIKLVNGYVQRLPTTGSLTEITIKVNRDSLGNWALYSKLPAETDFVLEGKVNDNEILKSAYSGIFCKYSSTNSAKYSFDDFTVTGKTVPLNVSNTSFGDLIFNELMVNPNPSVGLPASQYIELYNRRDVSVQLRDWTLMYGSKSYSITDGQLVSNGVIILCDPKAASYFAKYGNVAVMNNFPSLAKGGQLLSLSNDQDSLIAFVNYSDTWYGDDFKKSGGWSLECVDPSNLNGDMLNWMASNDIAGGTPDKINSVSGVCPDTLTPSIVSASLILPDTLILSFNKSMIINDLNRSSSYTFSNGLSTTILQPDFPKGKWVRMLVSGDLQHGTMYTVAVTHLRDLNQHALSQAVNFGLPDSCKRMDIVINEILSHPKPSGVSFVELYNRSQKIIDLGTLWLNRVKSAGGYDVGYSLSNVGYQLFPGKYVALTTSKSGVCTQYACPDSASFLEMNSLPSLPDAAGNVVLINRAGMVIDSVGYNESQHDPMIQNPVGVSFERISPDGVSNSPDNWHSASTEVGYATPSYRNSQYMSFASTAVVRKCFWTEKDFFTPDNDGSDDLLWVHYTMPDVGYSATITVYDAIGRRVKQLTNNALLGTQGVLSWNGLTDSGKLANVGVYLIYVDAVQPLTGKRVQAKLPCALSAR